MSRPRRPHKYSLKGSKRLFQMNWGPFCGCPFSNSPSLFIRTSDFWKVPFWYYVLHFRVRIRELLGLIEGVLTIAYISIRILHKPWLSWASEPKCRIFGFMWARGSLISTLTEITGSYPVPAWTPTLEGTRRLYEWSGIASCRRTEDETKRNIISGKQRAVSSYSRSQKAVMRLSSMRKPNKEGSQHKSS